MAMNCSCGEPFVLNYDEHYQTLIFKHCDATYERPKEEMMKADSIYDWQNKCIDVVSNLAHDPLYKAMVQVLNDS